MLEHWIRIRQAKKALGQGDFEEAIELTLDPLVRDHLKARSIRRRALDRLLDRARSHRARNNLSAAFDDVRAVLRRGERTAEAVELEREIERSLETRESTERAAAERIREVESDVREGRLLEARQKLEMLAADHPTAGALRTRIAERMAEAKRQVERARRLLRRGALSEAEAAVASAAREHPGHPDLDRVREACASRRAAQAREEVASLIRKGDVEEAWRLAVSQGSADGLVRKAERALVRERVEQARRIFEGGPPHEVIAVLDSLDDLGLDAADGDDLRRAAAAWDRALELSARGETDVAHDLLEVASELGGSSPALRDEQRAARETAERAAAALKRCRAALASGDVDSARDAVRIALESAPDRWLENVRRGLEEMDPDRIPNPEKVERTLEQGDLDEAVQLAVGLLIVPALAEEAGSALAEARERAEHASREFAGVERALLFAGSSGEVLAEARPRLDRGARLDRGSPLVAELGGRIEDCLAVNASLDEGARLEAEGNLEGALACYREGLERIDGHLECERRARRVAAALASDGVAAVEADLRGGRLEAAHRTAKRLLSVPGIDPSARARLAEIRSGIETSEEDALGAVREAERRFEQGDVDGAERSVERALAEYPGLSRGEQMERRIHGYRKVEGEVKRVERLLEQGRPEEAREAFRSIAELESEFAPVRRLRVRLESESRFADRFVIRVEEAADYLVLASDKIRVGNIMGEGIDLSIMANISTEHAELRRTKSFHGGCRYEVEALPGKECFVNDRPAGGAVELRHGDRVRLGESFEFRFELPSKRSKTARLELGEGFDVDGIRRILLMVPGREGRLVVAASPDAHIQDPKAEKPVEIYRSSEGSGPGELFCHCHTGVLVNGRGGTAEKRVPPGGYVQCGASRMSFEALV